jgi:tetratricopeptide (TPR) repeat protein/transcriptional regulator with XRE-family HTH domain
MNAVEPDRKAVGPFLRRARQTAGLTQEELAAKTGLSTRAIGDLERGLTTKPHRRSLELLAEVLELPESARAQLIGASGRPDTPDIAEAPRVPRSGPQFAPAQLPTDIPDFTGRASQVNELGRLLSGRGPQWLRSGAVRIALVVGAGGLGKTALAVHTAHLLASEFPDGQLYASLHGTTEPVGPSEVLARFLRDLAMDAALIPAGEEERAARYRTLLADRQMLVLLDDARDAAQVQPLLPGSGSCGVLVTARHRMPDLVGAGAVDPEVLPLEEARTLLIRVAGQERIVAEPAAADDVLAVCAGLPLAIRIAGARLAARSSWTVRTLADRLSDERRRLDELRAGSLAVRASFEVSFASLPEPQTLGGIDPAKAFRVLGLWTGPSASLSAACALLGEPEDAVADALDVLVDAHLLESPAPDRYRFHDLLRVYAADRAMTQEDEADRHAAIARVLAWYLYAAEAAARIISTERRQVPLDSVPAPARLPGFGSLEEAIAWCETERSALLAATRLAEAAGLNELAWKLPAAAMIFYHRRSHWADWVATHETGLASARALGDRLAEAWMLNNLGMAYGVQRRAESVTYLEQALALNRELGNGPGVAQAATNIAMTHFALGNMAEARAAAQRSIDIERKMGNRFGEGIALGILGSACRELGQPGKAIEFLDQALAISRDVGDRDIEAASLADLGEAFLGLGQIEDAIARLEDSLAIRESIGDRHGQMAILRKLGQAHRLAGNLGPAHELTVQALCLAEEIHDQEHTAEIKAELAQLTRTGGK